MSADDPNLIPVVTNATAQPAPPAIVDYLAPEPHNRYAARALVCGLLGFIPFVPGILAIRYGRRGLRAFDADPRIGGKGTAKAGLWLGVASIIAWTALAVGGVPALVVARRQAIRVHCASNLRQVAMAITMYAAGNRGFIPPDLDALVKSKIVPASSSPKRTRLAP